MSDVRELIIIGGGPAGYTAAIYAARANLRPLMIEGFIPGGQLMITNDVENYPGYPEGVVGPEMMAEFRRRPVRFGAEFITEDVTRSTSRSGRSASGSRTRHTARRPSSWPRARARGGSACRASGRSRAGVSACATCDGAFFQDQELIVVGGGDTAMEEATFLPGTPRRCTVVHRRDEFRASPTMVDRGRANRRSSSCTTRSSTRCSARRGSRACGCATRERARLPRSAPTASSSRSATTRTPRCSRPARSRTTTGYIVTKHDDEDQHPRRIRRGRRPGPHLPSGGDRRRLRLYGGAGRRALPRGGGAQRLCCSDDAGDRRRLERVGVDDPGRVGEPLGPQRVVAAL